MCAECGAPHPKNNPPCTNCGAMQFEKTVVRQQPEDEADPASVEWRCTECSRTHPKNSPPCSRCGNMRLESVEATQFDEDETSGGLGALDVAKFAGALAVVALLALATINTGVLSQNQAPTVENVPGDANESSGLDLSAVEYEVYEDVNEARSSEGVESLSLEPSTTGIADHYNKLMVKRSEYPLDTSATEVFDKFGSCPNSNIAISRFGYESETEDRAIDYYDDETQLADTLVKDWLRDSGYESRLLDRGPTSVGVDVHIAENGDIYATVTFC